MKITIDLDEFWVDGETDLESGLKEYVKNNVLHEIKESIKSKVETHLTAKIKEEVDKNLVEQMNLAIDGYIKSGTVRSYKESSKQVSLEEYVKERFTSDTGWGSGAETIKKLANQFGTEMKNRYDLLFASQLVAKMNENGLLKKEAAKLLLETK